MKRVRDDEEESRSSSSHRQETSKRRRSHGAESVSPLLAILEQGVREHSLVKSPDGSVYTGFANFRDLAASSCLFASMNSNRALNMDVVNERVLSNLERLKTTGSFYDFGQVHFLVINSDPTKTFHIMDGQHRCATMQQLLPYENPLNFQFRVKVVNSEEEAAEELAHFQNIYPTDGRSFFQTQQQTIVATAVLDRFKASAKAGLFRPVVLKSRVGQRTGDPDRPLLTDYIFFGILKDSGLLERYHEAEQVLGALKKMDEALERLGKTDPRKLGNGVTQKMVQKAKELNSFLGFLRPGKLEWKTVEAKML